MNLVTLLALPVVGGYAFSIIWIGSLYNSSRESGHRLYFRAIFYAVFLVVCSILIHIIVYDRSLYYDFLNIIANAQGLTHQHTLWGNEDRISVLFISFILGPLLANIINLQWLGSLPYAEVLYRCWQTLILEKAIKNNDFEFLLYESFKKEAPIMFTLSTGKVYIGRMVRAPNPIEQRRAIRIAPLLSGYRDRNTQEFRIITDYYEIVSELQKEPEDRKQYLRHLSEHDFEVILPSDSVCSSHLFDLEAFNNHFNPDEDIDERDQAFVSEAGSSDDNDRKQ